MTLSWRCDVKSAALICCNRAAAAVLSGSGAGFNTISAAERKLSVVDLVIDTLLVQHWRPEEMPALAASPAPGATLPSPPPRAPFFLNTAQIVQLCVETHAVLSKQYKSSGALARVETPVKVFGDVHGQMLDLKRLFNAFQSPHDSLGDILVKNVCRCPVLPCPGLRCSRLVN